MLVSMKFDAQGMTVIEQGLIPFQEIYDASVEFNNHPDFMNFRYQLFIHNDVEDFTVSANDVMELARMDTEASKRNPDIKVAIVSESPLVFGLGRMYEAFAEESLWDTRVFYKMDDALGWLGMSLLNK